MSWKNTAEHFGLPAKLLHWTVAFLMILLLCLGWYMVRLDYYHAWYYSSFLVHQWLGILVWFLGVLMLVWRLLNPSPNLPLTRLERVLSVIVHWLLFFAVLFLPISGLLVVLSDGNALTIGSLEIPINIPVSSRVRDWAVTFHYYVAYGAVVLILLHGFAALKHHFYNHDNTLRRMLW